MAINPTPLVGLGMSTMMDVARQPLPLDRIRQRRMEERELSRKERETEGKIKAWESEAATAKQEAESEAEENKRMMRAMVSAPRIEDYVQPGMSYEQERQGYHRFNAATSAHYQQAGFADLAKYTHSQMSALTTSPAAEGAERTSQADLRAAQTEQAQATAEYTRAVKPTTAEVGGLDKPTLTWATSYVSSTDPGKEGWKGFITPNLTTEQVTEQAYILGSIFNQIRMEYARENQGAQIPIEQAQREAEARYDAIYRGGTPQTQTPQPLPGAGVAPQPNPVPSPTPEGLDMDFMNR